MIKLTGVDKLGRPQYRYDHDSDDLQAATEIAKDTLNRMDNLSYVDVSCRLDAISLEPKSSDWGKECCIVTRDNPA